MALIILFLYYNINHDFSRDGADGGTAKEGGDVPAVRECEDSQDIPRSEEEAGT